jgi:hypothetical protein
VSVNWQVEYHSERRVATVAAAIPCKLCGEAPLCIGDNPGYQRCTAPCLTTLLLPSQWQLLMGRRMTDWRRG